MQTNTKPLHFNRYKIEIDRYSTATLFNNKILKDLYSAFLNT